MTILVLASSTGSAIAIAIGGIAAVLAISAVFYVIGRGEDRDRAAQAQAPDPDGATEDAGEPPPSSAARSRPATTRPRRRR